MTQETLIFLHIPKTAGTTVSHVLRKWLTPDDIFHIRADTHASAPRFSTHCGPIEYFRELPAAERKRFLCVLGHAKFGLHEQIPKPARYFTLLRRPLDRYVSQVGQFNRMKIRGELGADARPVSLYEFSKVKPLQFSNMQTRWICGLGNKEFLRRDPVELLELAKHNLEQWFAVVGVVEQIDLSLAALASYYDRRVPTIRRENVATERLSTDDLSAAQLQEFEEKNALDRELWRFARQRLQAQVAKKVLPFKRPLRQRVLDPLARVSRRLRAA